MLKGREQEALGVVAKLRRRPVEDEIVRLEYLEIKASVQFDEETAKERFPGKHGWRLDLSQYLSLFTRMPLFKRLAIGCIMQFFQQFTGYVSLSHASEVSPHSDRDQN